MLLLAALLLLALGLAARTEGFVYWPNIGHSENSNFAIGRANLNGSGVDLDFLRLPGIPGEFGTSVGNADAVAIDSSHIYWASGSIGRANLDSTGGGEGFIDTGWDRACDLVVDPSHLYWTTDGSAIGRANLDGTGTSLEFIPTGGYCGELAVDGSHVYWTNSEYGGGHQAIGRADLDGSDVNQAFIPLGSEPCGVAVDSSRVYWANGSGTIGHANLDGTGASEMFVGGRPCDLAVDGAHIYWVNLGGRGRHTTIGRANLDGSGVDTSFIPDPGRYEQGAFVRDVAVDALGSFSFGAVKRNKSRGTASLTVNVPAPGDLELAPTRRVKGKHERATAAGQVKLPIQPKRKAKETLRTEGSAQVKARITYTPSGDDPNIVAKRDTKPLKLVKRRIGS